MEFCPPPVKPCPRCEAAGSSARTYLNDDNTAVTGRQWFYQCGSWTSETPEGFKTAHHSDECKVRTAEVARSVAEVKFANHLARCNQDREGLIGTIRQLQHEAKQAGERFDEQLARAAAIYDELKEEYSRRSASYEVTIAELRQRVEQVIEANGALTKGRNEVMAQKKAIVDDLIRIQHRVREWEPGARAVALEWAFDGMLAIIHQATATVSVGTGKVNIQGVTMAGYSVAYGPRREPYIYDLTFETIDLLRSEGRGHVMAIGDGFHVTVANSDEGDALRVTVYPGNVTREQDWTKWPTGPLSVPTDRRDFPAAKAAALDALRRAGSQSPGSAQAQTRREPMTTKETIAKVIGILQMIAMITPIKFDDTALEFVIWASEKPWFIALVERILPASTADELEAQSLTFEPELITGLLEFSKETGRPVSGRAGKLLALITQVIAIAKAVKPLFGT